MEQTKMSDYPNNRPELKDTRRVLRKQPTRGEFVLWQNLRRKQLGVKFRRQFSIERYVLDFYCHELKLAIEVDGYTHDRPPVKNKDAIRQGRLESLGIRLLRFRDEEVLGNVEKVTERIRNEIEKLRAQGTPP